MRIVWTVAARNDVISIQDHIAADNVDAAEAVSGRIIEAVERLAIHPRLGRPGRVTGTRELPVAGTPYIAIYVVDADTVAIFRILHGAMKWPRPDKASRQRK
jgi:toxin ParE1/3/4